ncbi:hypothetical protein CYMTET_6363 [Cymbomonas tetramitiformis]|uniref:Putative gamma-glutamylcyclotransferase n=1 Tax=Cymbomonas tetramitiformis TaxID=36881 RepID=A0AAE0GX85_9CHLO|nr:hypothetical protein CYMTET_6363 [Cymbomonas tetramitiformis]
MLKVAHAQYRSVPFLVRHHAGLTSSDGFPVLRRFQGHTPLPILRPRRVKYVASLSSCLLPVSRRSHLLRFQGSCMADPVTSHGGDCIFVYGSLLAPEVLQVLLGRVPQNTEATLKGHRRYAICDRVYPAVIEEATGSVRGKVLWGLSEQEKAILDEFEDDEYERKTLLVQTEGSGETEAEVYVYAAGKGNLLPDWSYEGFRQVHLKDYIIMCQYFMEKECESARDQ